MVYDSVRDRIVFFGGASDTEDGTSNVYYDETWEFDGTNWLQRYSASTPTARSWHAMAYDSARGKTVLFGGFLNSKQNNETWEWDGTNWTQNFPATSPMARDAFGMVYDQARGKVVLFGGYNLPQNIGWLDDTWEWDGINWTQKFPYNNPYPRHYFAMAYDSARQKAVIFGGLAKLTAETLGTMNDLDETWEWDGTNWAEITPATKPQERYNLAMAYDSYRQRIVMYGGIHIPDGLDYNYLVWEYDGTNWTGVPHQTRPGDRSFGTSMIYDSLRKRVIMFR
ncbi:MAG: hypothetical protein HY762_05855 [Planctomycetes bacterium]|nr:hypothetical protein [Planctomycetota bacterium]